MSWIICIVFDRDEQRLLLIEQHSSLGYWFPYDNIRPDEDPTSVLIAQRIARRIHGTPVNLRATDFVKTRSADSFPFVVDQRTYWLFYKDGLAWANKGRGTWMDLKTMESSKLLGPEPISFLKTLLRFSKYPLTAQITSAFPDMPCPKIDDLLQAILVDVATSVWNVERTIRREFFSSTFPSDWMNFKTFCQVIRNKLRPTENTRLSSYFRAFDAQKQGFLTYNTYLLGLAVMHPKTDGDSTIGKIRCGHVFRFYNNSNDGFLSLNEFRVLNSDVEKMRTEENNFAFQSLIHIDKLFEQFQTSPGRMNFEHFWNMIAQNKYRGTSRLLRLNGNMAEWFSSNESRREVDNRSPVAFFEKDQPKLAGRYVSLKREVPSRSSTPLPETVQYELPAFYAPLKREVLSRSPSPLPEKAQYELPAIYAPFERELLSRSPSPLPEKAQYVLAGRYAPFKREVPSRSSTPLPEKVQHKLASHYVTLKRTGQVFQGKALLGDDSDLGNPSAITGMAIRALPRSLSTEIFNETTNAKLIQELLRDFNKEFKWTTAQYNRLPPLIIRLCKDVREIFQHEARCLKLSSPTYILGDLHGNYKDLLGFEQLFWRATPFLTPSSFLFLGDYVDRGVYGLEVVLYLFAMKYLFPKKVFLLRGNHEERNIQNEYGFHRECQGKFPGLNGEEIWTAINAVFDVLPLAAILCVHGGIPSPASCPGSFIDMVNRIPVPLANPQTQSNLAWELMWNDPKSGDDFGIWNSDDDRFSYNDSRRTAKYFTGKALTAFLDQNKFTYVVRAHQVQQVGFRVQLGGRLLTVFSSSHYAGANNRAAAVLVDSGKLRLIELEQRAP